MSPIITMPAITLWQPYACLIEIGMKPWETRSKPPPQRLMGKRVAIHAAARKMRQSDFGEEQFEAMTDAFGRCTWFHPAEEPLTARKQWIAGSIHPAGSITIDDGAARALKTGKSLLPAGVVSVSGTFDRGDAVLIKDRNGATLGKGLSAYSSEDAAKILGKKSADIETILGFKGRDVLIHRDDMVLE